MSDSYLTIEKLCLEQLHRNIDQNVCNFVKDGLRYISDSYCVWVLPEIESNIVCDTFVNYPNKETMVSKIYDLCQKYRNADCYEIFNDYFGEIMNISEYIYGSEYSMSKYQSFYGDKIWLQNKYTKSFEPFDGKFYVIPSCEKEPVIVKSGGEFIGLINPMHVNQEDVVNREQSYLTDLDLNVP